VNDAQRLRYSRHLLLDEWSEDLQQRLIDSHVVVVGAGGLGAPALMYLASAGVGRITLIDPDEVDLTNLQRQVVHRTDGIGRPKVVSARDTLRALNPEVELNAVHASADDALLAHWAPQADLLLDCTDRFDTRHLLNRASVRHGKPLVFASAVRWDGQLAVFDPRVADSPCYACLFPADEAPPEVRCATMGVFAPAVGQVGVMQAGAALRLLTGLTPVSALGRLVMVDGRTGETSAVRFKRQPGCTVCGRPH
jgi:molybdopterin/thiamine biosynthesis adenylyltransferase